MKQLTFLVIIVFALFYTESEAQRRKNKDGVSSATRMREAEYYFTEAEKYFILEDYAKSLALFQKSLEYDPRNATAYYKKAQIEYKNEEYDKALKDAEQALELDNSNKYFFLQKIEILTHQGKFDDAIDTYEQMIENINGTDHFLYEVAAIHLFQDNFDEALNTFRRLEDRYGESEEIGMQRHKIYHQQGKKDLALKELESLVNKYPFNENYPLALAEYLLTLNNTPRSIDVLTKTLETFPLNSKASLLLVEVYRKEKQYAKALPYLRTSFQNADLQVDLKVQLIAQYKTLAPDDQLTEMIMGLCETLVQTHSESANVYAIYGDLLNDEGKQAEAAIQYQKSLDLDESNFAVWQNLVLLHSKMNDFDNVILSADKAMVIFPNQNILYYLSGFAHLRKKLFEESVYLLKTGKRLVGDNAVLAADFDGLLGESYHGLKDYDRSDEAFDAVLSLQPNNYIVLNNYSYYLTERNENLDKAEKMSAKLVKDNPTNANFLDTHAWVLYSLKKYKEAKKIAEKAVDSGKAKAVHYEHYGDILFKLGDVDGAVIQWQKAKGMDSTLKFIDKKITDRKLYEK